MKSVLSAIFLCAALVMQGCAVHPAFEDDGYLRWSDSVIEKIKRNPSYKRIPIDTDEQADQFITLEYKAYKKEITKQKFIEELLKIYPNSKESIEWNANQLP